MLYLLVCFVSVDDCQFLLVHHMRLLPVLFILNACINEWVHSCSLELYHILVLYCCVVVLMPYLTAA